MIGGGGTRRAVRAADRAGLRLFEYYAAHPDTEASAAARMLARTLPVAREFAAADALRHHDEISGVLLERPGMLAHAKEYLSELAWPIVASSSRAPSSWT